MYKAVVRLLLPTTAFGTNPGPAESLVLSYLQDFHETVGDNFLDKSYTEIISHSIRNQLAIYRTVWRIEHFVKEIARIPAEDIGAAFKGRSLLKSKELRFK